MLEIKDLLDLDHTLAKDYLSKYKYPWEAISGISNLIIEIGKQLNKEEYQEVSENVWVHKTASVFNTAYLGSPCIIGKNTEVRHCAFIRGSALVGDNCVIGNSVELKNVIIFDNTQIPHFNYVGDSILGYHSHMGAGSITSNIRSDKKTVIIHDGKNNIDTSMKKFGAVLGDYVEVGCNAVLNPGTIIGKHSQIYPTSCVRSVVKENSIYKHNDEVLDQDK